MWMLSAKGYILLTYVLHNFSCFILLIMVYVTLE